jgi:hypothetical protein
MIGGLTVISDSILKVVVCLLDSVDSPPPLGKLEDVDPVAQFILTMFNA